MDLGQCPRCATPYSSSEVAGFGILRSRSARQGGPYVDYVCQSCERKIRLIPHGEGRYAPPGVPPAAYVPTEERRPPWMSDRPDPEPEARPRSEPEEQRPPVETPRPDPAAPPLDLEPPEAPIGPAEALELLGLDATASQGAIDRAFRERSRTCHPDKVAHLDAEFQELAERKFRRLKQAFELLSR